MNSQLFRRIRKTNKPIYRPCCCCFCRASKSARRGLPRHQQHHHDSSGRGECGILLARDDPMHKFVISGGLGLLGQRIIRHIFSTGLHVRVMVVDTADGDVGGGGVRKDNLMPGLSSSTGYGTNALNAEILRGDLGCPDVAAAIKSFACGDGCVDSTTVTAAGAAGAAGASSPPLSSSLSVFHLASVMSGQGEQDFDEALRVNIDGTRSLLDTCRQLGGRPRFVFASSIAAFGGGKEVTDGTKLLPQTTYGMTKACAEMLVNDCTRKGYVDGRIARLPTVIVRPGPPNPAATGCFSSVPKAVLNGEHFVSPVSSEFPHPCIGLSSAVEGLVRVHDASDADMGRRDRAVTLPAVSLTLRDLENSAAQLARDLGRSPGTVSYEPENAIEAVVKAMPSAVQASKRATNLGLVPDAGAHEIVDEFVKREWQRVAKQ